MADINEGKRPDQVEACDDYEHKNSEVTVIHEIKT